jgi:hypothetical protein
MFSLKPDYERTRLRMQAFWELEVLDRPLVCFRLPKPAEQQGPLPISRHTSSAERWLNAQYQAEFALADLSNQEFLGDSLPIAWPPTGFSSFWKAGPQKKLAWVTPEAVPDGFGVTDA